MQNRNSVKPRVCVDGALQMYLSFEKDRISGIMWGMNITYSMYVTSDFIFIYLDILDYTVFVIYCFCIYQRRVKVN